MAEDVEMNDGMSIVDAVAATVATLPTAHVLRLRRALEKLDGVTPAGRSSLRHLVESECFAESVERICDAWATQTNISGAALALALGCAQRAASASFAADLVWTGPAAEALGSRTTTTVLFDLIRQARTTLTLMSFSAYPIAGLVGELRAGADRGVAIRFILESVAASGGRLTVDAAAPFASLAPSVRFYEWPLERRAYGSVMHAKAVIADRRIALVTSANLTERGIDLNLELGLRLADDGTAIRIERTIDEMIAAGVLCEIL